MLVKMQTDMEDKIFIIKVNILVFLRVNFVYFCKEDGTEVTGFFMDI